MTVTFLSGSKERVGDLRVSFLAGQTDKETNLYL